MMPTQTERLSLGQIVVHLTKLRSPLLLLLQPMISIRIFLIVITEGV